MMDAIDDYFADGNTPRSDSSDDEEISHVLNAEPNRLPQEPSQHITSDNESSIHDDVLKFEDDKAFNNLESGSDIDDSESSFPSFGARLQPKFVEFSNTFPLYPKTHPEGYATVVELPPEILVDEAKVNQFRTALQYSMTKGHGIKTRHNVPFFSVDGEDVPMNYFYRQCNGMRLIILELTSIGVKACEFLPDEHRHHTEIDEAEGHPWARLLAAQEQAEEDRDSIQAELVFYMSNKDLVCDRYCTANNGPCGGRAVVRAFKSGNNWERLFIGCERYRQREAGHTFIPLRNHNPVGVVKLWGKERCWVPEEVLTSLGINWDDHPDKGINILLSARSN
jgi:hypothetical protein